MRSVVGSPVLLRCVSGSVSMLRTRRSQGRWKPSENRGISRMLVDRVGCGLSYVRCVDTESLVRHRRMVEPTANPVNKSPSIVESTREFH